MILIADIILFEALPLPDHATEHPLCFGWGGPDQWLAVRTIASEQIGVLLIGLDLRVDPFGEPMDLAGISKTDLVSRVVKMLRDRFVVGRGRFETGPERCHLLIAKPGREPIEPSWSIAECPMPARFEG